MFPSDRSAEDQVVLIVAHSPAFAQSLMERWRASGPAPAFSVLNAAETGTNGNGHAQACHIVIVEGSAIHAYRRALQRLDAVGTPIICALPLGATTNGRRSGRDVEPIALSPTAEQLHADFARMLVLNLADRDSGLDIVVTVAAEVLKRVEASLRAKKSEADVGSQAAQLALGKYVADSMHGFNNALTAVLGNAELLLLDSQSLPAQMQEQVEAIHSNAIRLHEMMQRFSSLEAEINADRKQGRGEAVAATQAYLSGT